MISPEEPESKELDVLVVKLMLHFQPKLFGISERYTFHCRSQGAEESIAEFVADLRQLVIRCLYQPAFLGTTLRDPFVIGLAKEKTKSRLLAEPNSLTFERAIEIAISLESAGWQLMKCSSATTRIEVHHALECKTQTHSTAIIRHRWWGSTLGKCVSLHKCRSCGKVCHIAKVCRSKFSKSTPNRYQSKFKAPHTVEDTRSSSSSLSPLPDSHQTFHDFFLQK